eukprot:3705073-Prymnesium_polylepis.2
MRRPKPLPAPDLDEAARERTRSSSEPPRDLLGLSSTGAHISWIASAPTCAATPPTRVGVLLTPFGVLQPSAARRAPPRLPPSGLGVPGLQNVRTPTSESEARGVRLPLALSLTPAPTLSLSLAPALAPALSLAPAPAAHQDPVEE